MKVSITATFPDDARARCKAVLRMLGARDVKVEIVEGKAKATPVKRRNSYLPESPEAKALHSLFHRQPQTEWSEKEIKAFLSVRATKSLTLENITLITAYYAAERAKGDGEKGGKHRRDLLTLLNNWPGELDRAQPRSAMKHIGQTELAEPPGFREWLRARQPDCKYGWNTLPPFLEGLQREFKNEHPELGWQGMKYTGVAV